MTDVADLPGVGEKTAEKLKEAGFIDMMSIAAAAPAELAAVAGLGDATSEKIIEAAREALDLGFEQATKVYEKRLAIARITTGSKALDNLLGGGIETGAVTEFHGAYGSSKSQVAHQLAVNVQLPKEKGGLDGTCIFIDTEATFRPERIIQMAKAVGLDQEKALENIFVARAYNSDHQKVLIEKAGEMIKERNVKLIIVDSATAHFRVDFSGRGDLASRQQKLNRYLHSIQRLADVYNIAVYITNQVMANPGLLFGDPTTPIGGHVMGHFSTYRVYVRRGKAGTRVARMVDSPNLPEAECVFQITEDGVRDVDDKKKGDD
ncbi:MAG: DNA repair and recombination protein RadA [Candidatus Aenigmatarchaeota archaeon]